MSNPFQLVIVQDKHHYECYMLFIYGDNLKIVQSRVSDVIVTAGYDADEGQNFATIPGSWTTEINGLGETSNVGVPGMWIFNCDGKHLA